MSFAMALAIFLLLLAFLALHRSRTNTKLKLPPGPPSLPIIGNLHHLRALPHHSLHKLSQTYGPLMHLKLGTIPTIIASSADVAKEFLKTHDLKCCSRPHLTSLDKLSYGSSDIAFAPYGEQWREVRKICIVNLFNAKKVSSFRSIREEEVKRMVASISSSRHPEINLRDELLLLTSNITCTTALGMKYCDGMSSDAARLREILNETQAMFVGFFFADYLPMLGWLDALTGMRGRLERNFRELDEFYQLVIDEHVNKMARQDYEVEDMVDTLLDMKKKGAPITLDHIKAILMNIFLAGTETSLSATEWAMVELMRSPEAMRRAQNEVRSLIGSKSKKMVDESDIDELHYLKSVIKETMRLHPPTPLLLQRETMQDFSINGYDIPAKSGLLINAWAIGRDPATWDKAEDFYPERFNSSSVDFRGHDFQLIPFGAGRRICPGMQSALLVIELALANLLCLFDWELPKGMKVEDVDMDEAPGLTAHRKFALRLVATKYAGPKG